MGDWRSYELALGFWAIFVGFLSYLGEVDKQEFKVVAGYEALAEPWDQNTSFGGVLKGQKVVPGCHIAQAKRYVEDNFLSEEEVDLLLSMMKKGMNAREATGGPTILDINSGLLKNGNGVFNIYSNEDGPRVFFSRQEYEVYQKLFDRVRAKIMLVNGLTSLHFTAPTFIARIIGEYGWTPKEMHDEYWHEHVDKSNTAHYDYSGLVYLSDYGVDFYGGEFVFLDANETLAVLPKRGRFITFASGPENPHRFLEVSRGHRYALSMWFTCNADMEYKNFLTDSVHKTETDHLEL